MIAGIDGEIVALGPARAYLRAAGVTYELHIPLNVQAQLEQRGVGGSAQLFVYHHFGESEQRLFGFQSMSDRELFIQLQNLRGVGVGLALSLVSHLPGEALLDLCEAGDTRSLQKIPRVGKATAETLVFEVRRKASRLRSLLARGGASATRGFSPEMELAAQALLQLGYKEKEAAAALQSAERALRESGQDPARVAAADWISESLRRL